MSNDRKKPKTSCLQTGPGPYGLKTLIGFTDHDPSHKRAPAYSVRIKPKTKLKTTGPGPYAIPQHLTNKGLEVPPAFTIAKLPSKKRVDIGPGPANYSIQNCKTYNHQRNAPEFTHGFRNKKDNFKTPGPGPANYKLPSCMGPNIPDIRAQAAYSLAFRPKLRSIQNTPGPANYELVKLEKIKKQNPAYSMKFRHSTNKASLGPGPNYLCNINIVKKKSPEFSFGVKYSPCVTIPFTEGDDV